MEISTHQLCPARFYLTWLPQKIGNAAFAFMWSGMEVNVILICACIPTWSLLWRLPNRRRFLCRLFLKNLGFGGALIVGLYIYACGALLFWPSSVLRSLLTYSGFWQHLCSGLLRRSCSRVLTTSMLLIRFIHSGRILLSRFSLCSSQFRSITYLYLKHQTTISDNWLLNALKIVPKSRACGSVMSLAEWEYGGQEAHIVIFSNYAISSRPR
jgi:hypothetical protein